jgi:multidrug efflux pump subunit AcrB
MWLVQIALRRPYTFVVMAMVIALGGVMSIRKTPTDIFPEIDIPVVAVVWTHIGLQPEDLERHLLTNYERLVIQLVNDVDHIESLTTTGFSVVKVYLRPHANIGQAVAQVTACSGQAIRSAPPGTIPPAILQYSATTVPVIQLALESDTLTEQQLYDTAFYVLRPQLTTVPGVQIALPYGGRVRTIMVDIDSQRLQGAGLSPRDVQSALSSQNLILPTGTAKLGTNEFPVVMNSSPATLDELASIPVKSIDGRVIYLRDVANVRDGSAPQTSLVHVEGGRSVLMPIFKTGDASTLDVVAGFREASARAFALLPKETRDHLQLKLLFDQSVFVTAATDSVIREALIAAGLTGLMILLFLGSWRSTLTVVISIPLSILFSIVMLGALGQTLNIMTLGGLALAVGILIDDATVEIENIHRNLLQRKSLERAIMDGARQVAVPALVSTLSICIVFAPIAFLTGAVRSLFVPMGMAVVFAMLMSYLLSRTLVPTMILYFVGESSTRNKFAAAFDKGYISVRWTYGRMLAWALKHRAFVVVVFTVFIVGSLAMVKLVGRDFFPNVDAGLIKLHVREQPGTRIEETEKRIALIERSIRDVIPHDEIETMLDVIGPPNGLNKVFSEGAAVSSADGQILISLKPGHQPTEQYMRALRIVLHRDYPSTTFFFLAPDITTQVLNFGLAAPIDLQIVGPIGDDEKTLAFTHELAAKVAQIPGAVDVHVAQVTDVPQIQIDVDRAEALQAGLTQRDVATDVLASLASSGQFAPTYWIDKRGVQYLVSVQTPQYAVDTIDAIRATPISTEGKPQTLGNLAKIRRTSGRAGITHFDSMRTFDVQANVDGTDLGSVVDAVEKIVGEAHAPTGVKIRIKGQGESMDRSFVGLRSGLALAIVLVYLLLVVFFQSWIDPFIILMALPGALAGIVWILFLTGTTLSVPALIGSIMSIGVATANSILVVSFANDQRRRRRDAKSAALGAAMTRLRPVLMTALAMILGMLPMAIGIGEGSEQNAPLGRAVIGGLVLATISTLVFVPVIYSLLRRRPLKQPKVSL